jgi:hypothetical protein
MNGKELGKLLEPDIQTAFKSSLAQAKQFKKG